MKAYPLSLIPLEKSKKIDTTNGWQVAAENGNSAQAERHKRGLIRAIGARSLTVSCCL
jgi:hypothetical protein